VSDLSVQIGPKRLEVLRELIPTATRIGLLVNPTNPPLAASTIKEAEEAARKLGLDLHVLNASTEDDLDAVFETCAIYV
jgi:putative ABC transport system substrate-binding protein